MGVFDDIKDSVPGRGKDDSSDMGSSDFDSNFSDNDGPSLDSQDDFGSNNQRENRSNRNSFQENQRSGNNPPPQNNSQRQQNPEHPNAQTGRPQRGNSSPQLSGQTERKMQNAGMDVGQQNRNEGRRNDRASGYSQDAVSNQRSDFDELKAQNEQIIELLKRINQNLQGRR